MTGAKGAFILSGVAVVGVLGTLVVRGMFGRSAERRSPEACVGELTSYLEEVRIEQGTLGPAVSFKASDIEARLNATESGSRQIKTGGSEDALARRIRQRCYQNCVLWSRATERGSDITPGERSRLFENLTSCLEEERHLHAQASQLLGPGGGQGKDVRAPIDPVDRPAGHVASPRAAQPPSIVQPKSSRLGPEIEMPAALRKAKIEALEGNR